MLKGNKGEWSEIYTLLKLLSDTEIHVGDENLDKIPNLFYPIIKILRDESNGRFSYSLKDDLVFISHNNSKFSIPIFEFKEKAEILLTKIKKAHHSSFEVPEIEDFLSKIKCNTLKAKSTSKTDIKIIIHDLKTNLYPELGFSIKSQLGSPSTLLNASKATNFIYTLSKKITEQEINNFNTIKGFNKKFEFLNNSDCRLIFHKTESPIFGNNLTLIDSYLPEIMSFLTVQFYSTKTNSISELTTQTRTLNPMNYDLNFQHNFYEYKIKHLLTDIALGLMPAKVWNGQYDATGGYLIIKEDGDILAYHIYNKNEFENYLFNNTKLETASTKRHDFGKIYEENGKQYLKLNLQIRFKK